MRSDRRPDDTKKRSRDFRGLFCASLVVRATFAVHPAGATDRAGTCQPRQIGGPERGQAAEPASRNLHVTAIPGLVAEGAKWRIVWQAAGNSADGIIPDKDGSVLVAQEDYDTVLKIDANGNG